MRTRRKWGAATSILACLLIFTIQAVAQPPDLQAQKQALELKAQACRSEVERQRQLSQKASAEMDRIDMEILKRQQQVLTAKRSGDSVANAQSELELSRDKQRLARARHDASGLSLRLAESQQAHVMAQLERLDLSDPAQGNGPPGEKQAAVEQRISTLAAEISGQLEQARTAQQAAEALASELEAKWGARLTGKKPEPERVYHAKPGAGVEPEEATDL